MQQCILADRLYVPEAYVMPEHLNEFVYTIKEQSNYDYGPFETVTGSIRTFSKANIGGSLYYAFSRGNIEKLGRLFGDLPWIDKTSSAKMSSPLQFKGQLHTWESKKIGQQEAVAAWLKCKSGIIKAPPRFGKTISAIYLLTKLGYKTLIITHQIDLLEQFYSSFLAFTNAKELQEAVDPQQHKRDATGRVFGFFHDYNNPEKLDVCLLCWQTFASKAYGQERIDTYGATWGLVIVDECHRTGGTCYARTVNRLHARHRLGLTGTVERVDGREFLLKDIIGPVVAEGRVATIPCRVVVTHTGIPIKYSFTEPFSYLYKRIFKSPGRMDIVLKDLQKDVDAGRYICFAFHRCSIKQLCEWTKMLQLLGIKAESFYGSCRDREGVLTRARTGETQVLVCNSQMLTGIDIPRWNTYYSAFPTSNVVFNEDGNLSGNFYQEFSRIRTPFKYEDGKEKQEGIIRDYVDTNSMCFGAYKKRYRAYKNQGFAIDIIKLSPPKPKL
jgi:hypothetical protein